MRLADAPLHARAVVGGFCSARTLKALLCTSRTAAERFSEPAVLRQVALTCHYCDAHFTGADNAPDACGYHPYNVSDWQDSQGHETRLRECCNVLYTGYRDPGYPAGWDEAKADAVTSAPPCIVDAHYAQPWGAGCPPPGARIQVLRLSDGEHSAWLPATLVEYALRPDMRFLSGARLRPLLKAKPPPWDAAEELKALLCTMGRTFAPVLQSGKVTLTAIVRLDDGTVDGTVPIAFVRWPQDAQPSGGISLAALAESIEAKTRPAPQAPPPPPPAPPSRCSTQ